MNKYAARGLCFAMIFEEKRRVVVLSRDNGASHAAFKVIAGEARRLEGDRLRTSAVSGGQRIDFANGGSIIFCSVNGSAGRGVAADLVYITDEAHRVDEVSNPARNERIRDDIAAMVATAGEVVYG